MGKNNVGKTFSSTFPADKDNCVNTFSVMFMPESKKFGIFLKMYNKDAELVKKMQFTMTPLELKELRDLMFSAYPVSF